MLLNDKELLIKFWQNIIYEPKQLRDNILDLTVKSIYNITTQGSIDFGGSEYVPSRLDKIPPKKESDPKYSWWTLSKGSYIIEFNEIPKATDILVIIFPHQRLLALGCYHPSFIAEPMNNGKLQTILLVSHNGVRIKENARISSAITLKK
ncbi:MAG: hypothetical protein ACTSR2_08240 [Candidatus Hodarchaeales archaeon]